MDCTLAIQCVEKARHEVTGHDGSSTKAKIAFVARVADGVIELALNLAPANEIGLAMLEDLERFASSLPALESKASALIVYSGQKAGFSAGADLREVYTQAQSRWKRLSAMTGVREFLERIHAVLNRLGYASPLTTIAAVHGASALADGFELALACDLIIADKMARFCFPELRLGLIPGFGGIPRLKRDIGNAVVRDLLLTGRSINATKALSVGPCQLRWRPRAKRLRLARATAAQVTKFDRRHSGSREAIHQADSQFGRTAQ